MREAHELREATEQFSAHPLEVKILVMYELLK